MTELSCWLVAAHSKWPKVVARHECQFRAGFNPVTGQHDRFFFFFFFFGGGRLCYSLSGIGFGDGAQIFSARSRVQVDTGIQGYARDFGYQSRRPGHLAGRTEPSGAANNKTFWFTDLCGLSGRLTDVCQDWVGLATRFPTRVHCRQGLSSPLGLASL
jgi:hypothetical protein